MLRFRLYLFALLLLGFSPHALGSEPEGRLILRPTLARQASGPALLRVDVKALTNVASLNLTIEAPPGLEVRSRRFSGTTHSLRSLAREESTVEEFSVLLLQGPGRVLAIRLDGVDESGRPFTQRVGIPIGSPGVVPQVRGGAAEFPAASPRAGDR